MNKKRLSYIALTICTILTMLFIFSHLNFTELFRVIQYSNIYYLFGGVFFMILFWVVESIIMDVLIKRVVPETTFWTSLKATMVGQYYSYLTPLASGGQPAQLYVMKKDDIPLSNGTAILVSKFILFQATVTLYSVVLGIIRVKLFLSSVQSSYLFVLFGFAVNIIGLSAIIIMAFNPKLLEKIIYKLLALFSKIKLVKNIDRSKKKVKAFIYQYDEGIKELKKDIKFTLGLFLATVIQITIFFSITFFIYKALGLSGSSLFDIITLQALLYVTIAFIPTPGNTGAAEVGFTLLMGTIFTGKLALIAALLWRVISYYFGLIVCGLFTLLSTSFKFNRVFDV